MNWVNLVFYIACSLTGICYILWKTKITHKTAPWLTSTIIWFGEIFWIIFVSFIIRSFVIEPFRIPSSSMLPTLESGDFILVNKYQYGLRLPGFNVQLTEGETPKRGDVVVFRFPPNPAQDYIKRIIATPGDIIEYRSTLVQDNQQHTINKILKINDEIIKKEEFKSQININNRIKIYNEDFFTRDHQIRELTDHFVLSTHPTIFNMQENCIFDIPIGFRCEVPNGYYFTLGDNRDESSDSRYWGFVPASNLVGKAIYIWMNFGNLTRIGSIN